MINWLAVNAPVDGLNFNLVEETYSGKLPEFAVFHTGYITALVVLSSVVPVFVAFVAVVADVAVAALPPIDKLATAVVLETVNGAVPVATVDVITPVTETVVNAPVLAVVAPTVPFMLIEAVPLALVKTIAEGVPKAGVTNVGLVAKTTLPLPVEPVSVGAVAKPATPVEVTNCGVVVVFPAKNNVVLSAD